MIKRIGRLIGATVAINTNQLIDALGKQAGELGAYLGSHGVANHVKSVPAQLVSHCQNIPDVVQARIQFTMTTVFGAAMAGKVHGKNAQVI